MKAENKRLLEAFEYLDAKYIDELFNVLDTPPRRNASYSGKRSYWYIPVLAACLLLLAFASPVINKVAEVISSFAAGLGSGTETLEAPETTNGMYGEYILTEEDLAQINEAYFQRSLELYESEGITFSDEEINELRHSKYSKFALTVDEAMERWPRGGRFYFGKYGECFIFAISPNTPSTMDQRYYTLGEYELTIIGNAYVVYNHEWILLDQAYDRGMLADEDVKILFEVYCEYYKGVNNNEESD